jgi:hypothetical protein
LPNSFPQVLLASLPSNVLSPLFVGLCLLGVTMDDYMLAPKYRPGLELMVYLSRREENLDSKVLSSGSLCS